MSKVIAITGGPGSGKTSLALKLAQEIYFMKQGVVIFLSPDLTIPAMAQIFPNAKPGELYSLGVALDKTDIYREDIYRQLVSVKTMKDFSFLGYKLGENQYSYPRPTEDKVEGLFRALREIADYIVVDCTCDRNDLISEMAMGKSDVLIQVVNPDMKCMAYYASHPTPVHDHKITVMNILDKDLYLPVAEVKEHFKDISVILPYSRPLKHQGITGALSERLSDGKFHAEIAKLARQVI